MSDKMTMITTCDTDVHLIPGDIDMVRMKIDKNKWLLTTDGRYVTTHSVVSAWEPTVEEMKGFIDGIN